MKKGVKFGILLIISMLIGLLNMIFVSAAIVSITVSPADGTNTTNTSLVFSCTPFLNSTSYANITNVSLYTNIRGVYNITNTTQHINTTAPGTALTNNTAVLFNYSDIPDGNYTWNCVVFDNTTDGYNMNASANRTFVKDTAGPVIIAQMPNTTTSGDKSYSSYPIELKFNATDTNLEVIYGWYILNSLGGGTGSNDTLKFNMSGQNAFNGSITSYWANLTTTNFSSPYLSPGNHSVFFCANDTLGNTRCGIAASFRIMGANSSELINIFNSSSYHYNETTLGSVLGTLGRLNLTYENATPFPLDTMLIPSLYNFTMRIAKNISSYYTNITIVGIDNLSLEQFANMTTINISFNTSNELKIAIGIDFDLRMGWLDPKGFLPSLNVYKYGIIEIPKKLHQKVSYCTGQPNNPSCSAIGECSVTSTAGINWTNHASIIPSGGACWINGSGTTTYVYVSSFSGGALAGNDTGAPVITYNYPGRFGNTTDTTPIINITLTDNTGILNTSINITISNITMNTSGFILRMINLTNANLSCTTYANNATNITCNFTTPTLPEGEYNLTVKVMDTLGNVNDTNLNTPYVNFTIDTTAPYLTDANWFNTNVSLYKPSNMRNGTIVLNFTFDKPMNQTLNTTVTISTSTANAAVAGKWISSTSWNGSAQLTSAFGDGTVTINVSAAKDPAGNTMTANKTNTFTADFTPPKLVRAYYIDHAYEDTNQTNDTVVLVFSEIVNISGDASKIIALGLNLTVTGDGFNSTNNFGIVRASNTSKLNITLNVSPTITARGSYNLSYTGAGNSSGVEIRYGQVVINDTAGNPATGNITPVDIADAMIEFTHNIEKIFTVPYCAEASVKSQLDSITGSCRSYLGSGWTSLSANPLPLVGYKCNITGGNFSLYIYTKKQSECNVYDLNATLKPGWNLIALNEISRKDADIWLASLISGDGNTSMATYIYNDSTTSSNPQPSTADQSHGFLGTDVDPYIGYWVSLKSISSSYVFTGTGSY